MHPGNPVEQPVTALSPDLRRDMELRHVWKPDCPVPLDRLVSVAVRYVDFSGDEHDDGLIVTLDVAGEYVHAAFEALYQLRFPIEKMRSVHQYNGDDEQSMEDNNTSCFCHRPIEGTTIISMHSYGLAVDLNPRQNPYLILDEENGIARIYPKAGWQYLNRRNQKPGMVEEVVELWAEFGFFVWGGTWTTPLDYHHFQTTRGIAELLLLMDRTDGRRLWDLSIQRRDQLKAMPSGKHLEPLKQLYLKDKERFFKTFAEI